MLVCRTGGALVELRRSLFSHVQMQTRPRNVAFASGKQFVFSEDAVRRGAEYETLGLKELAEALGAPPYIRRRGRLALSSTISR